jgi:hypothetical protein
LPVAILALKMIRSAPGRSCGWAGAVEVESIAIAATSIFLIMFYLLTTVFVVPGRGMTDAGWTGVAPLRRSFIEDGDATRP